MLVQEKGMYVFEGLSEKEIAYFIMMSESIEFRKWSVIMSEGDASDNRAYFIKSGSVDVYRRNTKITTLHKGDIFGEIALITNEPRSARVVSNTDTEVLAFSKDEFVMLCKHSDIYEEIKQKILTRVKENFYNDK